MSKAIKSFLGMSGLISVLAVPVFAAAPEYCGGYASAALLQFQKAQSLGIPNMTLPVWTDNYQRHYQWCLTVPESDARTGSDFRDFQISRFSSGQLPSDGSAVKDTPGSPSPLGNPSP